MISCRRKKVAVDGALCYQKDYIDKGFRSPSKSLCQDHRNNQTSILITAKLEDGSIVTASC